MLTTVLRCVEAPRALKSTGPASGPFGPPTKPRKLFQRNAKTISTTSPKMQQTFLHTRRLASRSTQMPTVLTHNKSVAHLFHHCLLLPQTGAIIPRCVPHGFQFQKTHMEFPSDMNHAKMVSQMERASKQNGVIIGHESCKNVFVIFSSSKRQPPLPR